MALCQVRSTSSCTAGFCTVCSPDLREHVRFEGGYCLGCSMEVDLRAPGSIFYTLYGGRQCNEHSLGQAGTLNKHVLDAAKLSKGFSISVICTSVLATAGLQRLPSNSWYKLKSLVYRTSARTWQPSCGQRSAPLCSRWSSHARC